ncbi:MAG: proton-conducting transporter membrane subunit [Spirosomataceae bacterium]
MDIQIFYFLLTAILATAGYIIRRKVVSYLLLIPFVGLQIFYTYHAFSSLNQTEDRYFRADHISLIFLTVLTILLIPTILHSYVYAASRNDTEKTISIHNGTLMILFAAITGALVSSHLGQLWAFTEASTLSATVLIYNKQDANSLEAAWKYVFISSIAISLAFIGILFLGFAARDAGVSEFGLDELRQAAPKMSPTWMKMSFILIVCGFSGKMGIAPFFMVDIDAKDRAPTPISAIFASGFINLGFVAILRVYEIFAGTSILGWMNNLLTIIGCVSIFFATSYLQRVKGYKRMFAYSGLEHGGIVLLALAAGGLGYLAMLFHLVVHSFAKSSMFYQVGQVYRVFLHKSIDNTGNYFKLNPVGGVVLLIGFFCVNAMPPTGMFLSEYLTFQAMFQADRIIPAVLVLILLTFNLFALGRNFMQLLFGNHPEYERKDFPKINPIESVTQLILLAIVVYLGINPPAFLMDFLHQAIAHLPQTTQLVMKP